MPYYLNCQDCTYQDVVGELDQVLTRKEQHHAERGADHSVAFEAVDEKPLFRGGVSPDWE